MTLVTGAAANALTEVIATVGMASAATPTPMKTRNRRDNYLPSIREIPDRIRATGMDNSPVGADGSPFLRCFALMNEMRTEANHVLFRLSRLVDFSPLLAQK
jgi:hypothetical protein